MSKSETNSEKYSLKWVKYKTPNPKEACLEFYLFWSFNLFKFRISCFGFDSRFVEGIFKIRKRGF